MGLKTALKLNLLRNSYRPATQNLGAFSVMTMVRPTDTRFLDLMLQRFSSIIFILHGDHMS